MTTISHRYRFVFVRTKKTAGTSIERGLQSVLGHDDIQNGAPVPRQFLTARERLRRAAGKRPQRFYNHMPAVDIRRFLRDTWDDYLTFSVDRNPWDLAVSAYAWRTSRYPDEWADFEAFIMGPRLPKYSNWPRYTIDGTIAVDLIIRFERLTDGIEELRSRTGLPQFSLPHARARTDRRPYQDWYTDNTRERVAEVFNREIAHFGWTFH